MAESLANTTTVYLLQILLLAQILLSLWTVAAHREAYRPPGDRPPEKNSGGPSPAKPLSRALLPVRVLVSDHGGSKRCWEPRFPPRSKAARVRVTRRRGCRPAAGDAKTCRLGF